MTDIVTQRPSAQAKVDTQDCLSCRIIGTAALAGVGVYALRQSRAGQPGSPASRRVMAGIGLCFLGASYLRWNNFKPRIKSVDS